MSRGITFSTENITLIISVLALLAAFLIGLSIYIKDFYHPTKQKTPNFSNPENQSTYERWYNRIKQLGGKQAYILFKAETEKKSLGRQHEEAHLFGEALYQIEGIKGISVCDTSFNYGCYHSFLGAAINAEGLDVVNQLSNKCFEHLQHNGLACQHGIGHGVLSDIGYDLKSLNKALAICDKLKDKDIIGGCPGGVFMEYNFQTMLLDEGKMRSFDLKNPYFPCFNINKFYTGACFYQQAQWWLSSINLPSEEKVAQIDLLCQNLSDDNLEIQCYKGFGINIISHIGFDVESAKKICTSLTSEKAQVICRSGVAISLRDIPSLTDQSQQLCKDSTLAKSLQELCQLNTDQIATSPTKNQI